MMQALADTRTDSDGLWTTEVVFQLVQECFVEALGVEPEEVHLKATVIDDLGAESLDFLDIAFRLERAFDIKIPRGDVQRRSQEGIESEYEVDGVLTPLALDKLRVVMPEVAPSEICEGLTTKEIPRLFLVETFYNICIQLLNEKGSLA